MIRRPPRFTIRTPSFPTRRSSDLAPSFQTPHFRRACRRRPSPSGAAPHSPSPAGSAQRSEEHTSDLQSLMRISYAVVCLKQKKTHEEQSTSLQSIIGKPTHRLIHIKKNTQNSTMINRKRET